MSLITLAEVHTHLNLGTKTTWDDFLKQLIPQVSKSIETWCKRKFETDNYYELYNGNGTNELLINNSPIVSVGILSLSLDLTAQTYETPLTELTDFFIDKPNGMIEVHNNTFYKGQRSIYIEYVAGYASIPDDIKLVALGMTGKVYYDMIKGRFGVTQKNVTGENITFDYEDMTKAQKEIIKRYRVTPYSEGIRLDTKFTAA